MGSIVLGIKKGVGLTVLFYMSGVNSKCSLCNRIIAGKRKFANELNYEVIRKYQCSILNDEEQKTKFQKQDPEGDESQVHTFDDY